MKLSGRELQQDGRTGCIFAILLVFGLGLGVFVVTRYQGLWTEGDTARITQAILATIDQATITPERFGYQHGFGYQSAVAALYHLTGVSPATLQKQVLPLLGPASLALMAFPLYLRLTGRASIAGLASLFLVVHGDLLFVTTRGSHEKLIWPLILAALFLLVRSVSPEVTRGRIPLVLTFYLVIFVLVATNVFFASSFLAAIAISALISLFAFRNRSSQSGRQGIIAVLGGLVVFLFLAYLYPPAQRSVLEMETITERLSSFLLGFEPQTNPYSYIAQTWVRPWVFPAISVTTWIVVLFSVAQWLRAARDLVGGRDELELDRHLDWMLYAGFSLQLGAAVIMDFAGVLGTNLQLRLFPGFLLMAAPLAARAGLDGYRSMDANTRSRVLAPIIASVLFLWMAIAGPLKATNEPQLSNKWTYFLPAEAKALAWTVRYTQFAHIWTGADERLTTLGPQIIALPEPREPSFGGFLKEEHERYALLSDEEAARIWRAGLLPPDVAMWNLLYHNGGARIMKDTPSTPFQQ